MTTGSESESGTDDGLEAAVAAAIGEDVAATEPLHGGMIGEVHRVELAGGRTVVAKRGETPLSVEAAMLAHLATASPLPVPDVYHASDDLLILEHVPGDSTFSPTAERDAAEHLAALHEVTADRFGFGRDTLLGPLELPNDRTDAWGPFFRDRRLSHFADLAAEAGAVDASIVERVERLAADLDDLLAPPDAPALVHGDVWRENVLAADGAVTAFLDPAIYYGHPEIDLAYIRWTGAFGDPFFDRYRERREVAPGFDERWRVYALPRVLVHALLFGGSYPRHVDEMLEDLGY